MNNFNHNDTDYTQYSVVNQSSGSVSKKFFAKVFTWMFAALAISTITAYIVASNENIYVGIIGNPILRWVVLLSPIVLVLIMSRAMQRLSFTALAGIFILYSVLTGMMLSSVLIAYTQASVLGCFLGATSIFGIMAFLGYTTNIDLTKFGTLLFIGLIGLIIVSLINMFLNSSGLEYILSFFGVAIFTGLTAYDMQKLKIMSQSIDPDHEDGSKMAVMGALSLYLDFINIFLYLLRLFGRRN